ncbi:hypothetical protein EXIGLDRAFT_771387 [Exidia glandulosa HHB12029]|uniref:Uncharacterized protein n=1 Tax=Exidia glandulosa HHB12029 TaxID=1314781 RepID=A0A165G041_EXIGL|nr:hypothetical protein EXIGLDRAFT_771387 [Exidia glandulosa HHB12029]
MKVAAVFSFFAVSACARSIDMRKRQDDFKPNFSAEVTMDFQYPIEKVFAAFGSDQTQLCKLVLLSDIASDCQLLARDTVDVAGPLEDTIVRAVPASANGTGFPRQHYTYKETIKIIPGISLFDIVVDLPGTNTWDEERKVVLYETASESQGVFVKKTRFFESIDDGKATRYTEKIVGQCNWILQPIVQNQATKTAKQVSSLYHTMFE